jgi:uncharacterized protein YkwD
MTACRRVRTADAAVACRVIALAVAMVTVLWLAAFPAVAQAVTYSSEELEFVRLVNDYREGLGLVPLMVSDICSDAAEKHSHDMGTYGFFNHNTMQSDYFPVGYDGGDRMVRCGYHYNTGWGECIGAGYLTAAGVFSAWKTSTQGHNEVMTNPTFRQIGIGLVHVPGSEYEYYWTADFASIEDETAHWVDDSGPSTTTTTTTTTTTPSTTSTTIPPTTTTTTSTTLPRAVFADVSASNVFYEPITSLAAAGVVSGYGNGLFRPDYPVTRAQFAKMVVLALGKHTPEVDNAAEPTFPDVPYTGNVYPFDYVEEAVAQGIIQGYGDGTFGPDSRVTRLQLALMLVRAGGDSLGTPPAGYKCKFTDVPSFARDEVRIAVYKGLVSGKSPTFFDSYGDATRGHVAKMIYGLLQVLSN